MAVHQRPRPVVVVSLTLRESRVRSHTLCTLPFSILNVKGSHPILTPLWIAIDLPSTLTDSPLPPPPLRPVTGGQALCTAAALSVLTGSTTPAEDVEIARAIRVFNSYNLCTTFLVNHGYRGDTRESGAGQAGPPW